MEAFSTNNQKRFCSTVKVMYTKCAIWIGKVTSIFFYVVSIMWLID